MLLVCTVSLIESTNHNTSLSHANNSFWFFVLSLFFFFMIQNQKVLKRIEIIMMMAIISDSNKAEMILNLLSRAHELPAAEMQERAEEQLENFWQSIENDAGKFLHEDEGGGLDDNTTHSHNQLQALIECVPKSITQRRYCCNDSILDLQTYQVFPIQSETIPRMCR